MTISQNSQNQLRRIKNRVLDKSPGATGKRAGGRNAVCQILEVIMQDHLDPAVGATEEEPEKADAKIIRPKSDYDESEELIESDDEDDEIEIFNRDPNFFAAEGDLVTVAFVNGEWRPISAMKHQMVELITSLSAASNFETGSTQATAKLLKKTPSTNNLVDVSPAKNFFVRCRWDLALESGKHLLITRALGEWVIVASECP